MTTIQESYTTHVHTIRELGDTLAYAVEVRYQPPPSGASRGGGLVSNPTLDTVLDPRRMDLSDEVRSCDAALRTATAALATRTEALRRAVERWEGQKGN